MGDPKASAAALNELLEGCALTLCAAATRDGTPITAKLLAESPLPERLEKFLTVYIEHPDYLPECNAVMSAVMQDFGLRVYRMLLVAGLCRPRCDIDLAQNKADLVALANLLKTLAVECLNTSFIPRGTVELISRGANALHDVRWNNSRPALITLAAPAKRWKPPPDTADKECEGRLAAALEIVIAGGMKLALAKSWLDREMRAAGLVDSTGNVINAGRVAQWRANFRKRKGSARAMQEFDMEIRRQRALINAPAGKRKREACEDYASRLIRLSAALTNRAVPPLKDRARKQ